MQNDNSKLKNKIQNESHPVDGGFLQSKYWADFQKKIGRKTVMLENDSFSALMIFHELPLVGGYFFVPRGPLFQFPISNFQFPNKPKTPNRNVKKELLKMVTTAVQEKAGWIRVEPQTDADLELIKRDLGAEYKIAKSKKDHEPAQTLMLDLEKSEEQLLAEMKQKTRYNIRLAGKKGVEIFSSSKEEDVEKFIELTKETARRDKITPHPDQYYREMIATIPADVLKVYFAKFEGKIISVAMVSFFGSVATYLHGASSNEHRNVMAPFALQWRVICDAKKMGMKRYDFGGTKLKQETRNKKQETKRAIGWVPEKGSWRGITKFKLGFCPHCEPVNFPGCWDVVIDGKKYYFYRFLQGVKDFRQLLMNTKK